MIERQIIDTDILIIGGGTAGCMAAVEALEEAKVAFGIYYGEYKSIAKELYKKIQKYEE